jgi:broad specificity phosphatase PhoE/orotate phosphoribosyltransferase
LKIRLIFVRHAEAEGNVNRRFHGWTDSELTEKGHIQAEKLAERFRTYEIDVLYSSTLKRTLQTAGYISKVKGIPIIRTDKLKEINGGEWEDELWEVLPKKFPGEYETWEYRPHMHRMPDGESMVDFQNRLIDEVKYIASNNKGKNVCIVTHGTAIKALMCHFRGCDLEEMLNITWFDNTSVTIIDLIDGKFDLVLEGDTSHLDKELLTIENQDWWLELKKNTQKMKTESTALQNGQVSQKLVSWLFETNAIRVGRPESPFWYTSGTIGPYYVNTHYLYGSGEKAEKLLKIIDEEKLDIISCPIKVLDLTRGNYENDLIYRGLIDEMCDFIKKRIDLTKVDCISGGERRDWFFSLIAADILQKPHLTIYKDLTAILSYNDKVREVTNLNGVKILHIADLVTQASSFERSWIPAVKMRDGSINWSVSVVDRMQGGAEVLHSNNIEQYAMIYIDKKMFDMALDIKVISDEQHKIIVDYLRNPWETMRNFLKEHPEFLKNSLKSDPKTRERAGICIDKDIYKLKIE